MKINFKFMSNIELYILIILVFISLDVNGVVIQSHGFPNDCSGNTSCSPSYCKLVSNSKCTDPLASQTATVTLSKFACRSSCSQSTQAMCKTVNLASVIKELGGLKAAYCTDKFLVIHSTGQASHPTGLANIPHPPGEGGVPIYNDACVTRSYHQQYAVYKIPLFPQLLPQSLASNNMDVFTGQTDPAGYSSYGLPTSGVVAVSITGQAMFPIWNDQGYISHEFCEMDKCSAHAGQGFDYHYHGDPFGTLNGTCMYSLIDYTSITAHPPQIAWSLDGFTVYGRHLNSSAVGATTPLDDCGGHVHNDITGTLMTYHYHAQVLTKYTDSIIGSMGPTGQAYHAYIGGVFKCWRGNISSISLFKNSAALTSRADYQLLRPCCDTTEVFTAAGTSTFRLPTSTITSAPTTKPSTRQPTTIPTTTPPTLQPSLAPSQSPSMTPTLKPSQEPTMSLQPSKTPTTSPTPSPSTLPTALPTPFPSGSPTATLLVFQSKLTFYNLTTTSLTTTNEKSIIKAAAESMDIPLNTVSITSSTVTSNTNTNAAVLLSLSLLATTASTTAIVTIQSSIPLQGSYAQYSSTPSVYYNQLKTALTSAITSASFAAKLSAASKAYGETNFLVCSNITSASFSVKYPSTASPSIPSSTASSGDDSAPMGVIIGASVGGGILICAAVAFAYYFFVQKKILSKVNPFPKPKSDFNPSIQ